MAVEVMMSEFDLFKPEAIQNNVDKWIYQEFTPLAALQHGSPIEFAIPGGPSLAINLSKSQLYIRAKITKADGAAPAADAEVGPVNLTLQSLFSTVDVILNGKTISDQSQFGPYRAFLETLLTYSEDVLKTRMQSELWYKDTAGKMKISVAIGDPATNLGLKERAAVFTTGKEVEMIGRLHADIFHQNLCLPASMPLKIKLTPSKDKFVLIANDAELYRMEIVDARLFVHTFEMTKALAMAQEEALLHANLRYPIQHVTMKTLTIPTGMTSSLHDNIYLGQLPDRIVIGMVSDAAMSGAYKLNPFNFENFGVNYLALTVNGQTVPNKPYQPDFVKGLYIRELNSLYDAMALTGSNKTISINKADYQSGYTLYAFDLTSDNSASKSSSAPKSGTIRLEVKFAAATAETINVLLYAEFRSRIEIDKYRNVIVPY